ncbi:hypothetical protein E7T06_07425 [Deinococcus sp. Arct2-2]|uniref:hypothetical protein n=1 Tax=Deinococcus sp. Arct2-2 TaxID=2568653 RepID=UPI0010A33DF2|nr:hypothetical protein [Deinococcus sp. Arct2-2]THF70526.1 hypothetical protein E7T06_07425 [Deinococcus sp. Arct2-2]
MSGIDFSAFLPIIAKSGAATIILAILFGLSYVIREWRGGSMSEKKDEETQKRLADVEARLATAEKRIASQGRQINDFRFQRDQARVRVEFLELKHSEEPRTIWAPDPPEDT